MSDAIPATSQNPFPRLRELTAVIGLPLLVYIIGWAPEYAYVAFIAVIAGLALLEFLALGERKGYAQRTLICLGTMVFLLLAAAGLYPSLEVGVFAVLIIVPTSFLFGRAELHHALPATAVAVFATLYIGMFAGALLRLRLDFPLVGAKLIFHLLVVVWMGDTGGYYIGRNFGRRKLSPRISPKKTLEGALGGVIFSMIGAVLLHFAFFREMPLHHALFSAALLFVGGLIGDLAESLWKRSAGVKDSGTLIPGHGGFLDRLDSVLFTAPLLYAYWLLFGPVSPTV